MAIRFAAGLLAVFVSVAATGGEEPVAKPDEYRFLGGERIRLFVPRTVGESFEQLVTSDGAMSLPTGGTVNIKGKTLTEAQELVAQALEKESSVRRVSVAIALSEIPVRRVYVGGEVKFPQALNLTPGVSMTLAAALTAAGGTTPEGDVTRANLVRRGADGVYRAQVYDASKLSAAGNTELGPELQPGDVITVARGEAFVLAGEVVKPGVYTRKDLLFSGAGAPRLSRVLFAGGGLKPIANRKDIRLIRTRPDGSKEVALVNLDEALGGKTRLEGSKNDEPKDPAAPDKEETGKEPQPGLPGKAATAIVPADADPVLVDGDIVLVGGSGGVAILGKVKLPGIYPTGGDTIKLTRLIALAGGFADFAKTSSVIVVRAGKPKEALHVDVGSITKDAALDKDIDLQDGDLVFVGERML